MSAAEQLLGTSAKVRVLHVLRASPDAPLTLSELARRSALNKSTVRGAVTSLTHAGVVVDESGRGRRDLALRIPEGRTALVDQILALDDADRPPPGAWAADDADGRLIAWDHDPRQLVAQLRWRGERPRGIWRVPAHGENAGGSHGQA